MVSDVSHFLELTGLSQANVQQDGKTARMPLVLSERLATDTGECMRCYIFPPREMLDQRLQHNSKPAVKRQPGFRRGTRRAGYLNLDKIHISNKLQQENSYA